MEPLLNEIKPGAKKFRHPRVIFVPSAEIIEPMVRAALQFGNKETPDQFLLRFGLIENV
jgi:hypothetical protein